MKKRMLSLGLCLALALGLMAVTAPAEAVDLEQPCTLTVRLGSKGFAEDLKPGEEPGEGEDQEPIDTTGVVFDLYQVAAAEPVSGYDTVSFRFLEGYEELAVGETMDNAQWHALAQDAARLALNPGGEPKAALKSALPLDTPVEELGAGLYLVIARGAEMTPAEYITQVRDEEGNEHIATIAESKEYTYTFQPELAALPTKGTATDPETGEPLPPNTANEGEWVTEVLMELKPERDYRFGTLRIVKGLDLYENSEPATFVFSVVAEKDGEIVYSNVVGLTFSAAGLEEAVLDRIPVGSTVTVTEIYSGASYTISGDAVKDGVITAEEVLELTFENTYDNDQRHGHGIINQFSYLEDETGGGWEWVQDPAQQPGE